MMKEALNAHYLSHYPYSAHSVYYKRDNMVYHRLGEGKEYPLIHLLLPSLLSSLGLSYWQQHQERNCHTILNQLTYSVLVPASSMWSLMRRRYISMYMYTYSILYIIVLCILCACTFAVTTCRQFCLLHVLCLLLHVLCLSAVCVQYHTTVSCSIPYHYCEGLHV